MKKAIIIFTTLAFLISCAGKMIKKPIQYKSTNPLLDKNIGVLFDEIRFKRTKGVHEDDLKQLVEYMVRDLDKYSSNISFYKLPMDLPRANEEEIQIHEKLKIGKGEKTINFTIPKKDKVPEIEGKTLTHLLFIDEIVFGDIELGKGISHPGTPKATQPFSKGSKVGFNQGYSDPKQTEFKTSMIYILWDYENQELYRKKYVKNVVMEEGLSSNPNQISDEANMFAKQILCDLKQ